MNPSRHSLLARVHEQASLEERHAVDALYALIDPAIRRRREEERDDEPGLTLEQIRQFVLTVTTAEVENVQVLQVQETSKRHGGRPAALVSSLVRYNQGNQPQPFRTIWVRDNAVWYSTAIGKIRTSAA